MNFIDLTYHHLEGMHNPEEIVHLHRTNLEYLDHLPPSVKTRVIKFMDYEGRLHDGRTFFHFFKGKSRKTWVPREVHGFMETLKPDVILVHGLIWQLQVLALRRQLGKGVKILVQHHGEQPFVGVRRWLQKYIDKHIDGYLFASKGIADEWIKAGLIKDANKIYEVLPGSSWFRPLDKQESKRHCGMGDGPNFLWVGRLNANKDPVTVLKGFLMYQQTNPAARLYMIYQTTELLAEIKALCNESVILIGRVDHSDLQYWYSAADYFIAGSHRESCGYALLEAMACGCTPIVTRIPSFVKITGRYGFKYEPGNVTELSKVLSELSIQREVITDYFQRDLSFEAVAITLISQIRNISP